MKNFILKNEKIQQLTHEILIYTDKGQKLSIMLDQLLLCALEKPSLLDKERIKLIIWLHKEAEKFAGKNILPIK